jgi:hypothetical protein
MKKAGKSSAQIAKRLREEGRINYQDKTITSRYVRIMRAQAKKMEEDAASAHTKWEEGDVRLSSATSLYSANVDVDIQLRALARVVVAVDSQILRETERLARRRWQLVVNQLRASRPEGIFSKAECERRYNQLVREKQSNANDSEFQPEGSQASASQPSTSQLGSGDSDDEPSPPRATDSEDYDGGSSEAEGDGSQMGKLRGEKICEKATIGRKVASGADSNTAKDIEDIAEVAAILNRGLRAVARKSQENATSGSGSEQYEPVASAASMNGINGAKISADSAAIAPYNDALDAAPTDPPAVVAPTIISNLAMATSNTTTSPKYTEHDYALVKMLVCGREVPEPAATGRRLLVQNLPCWVTLTEIQIIFQEFNL